MVLVSRLGERYGTLICDLQGRRIIDLLPDRVPATLDAWLSAHPGIAIVARDRGGGYAQAVSRVRPDALQVADRWHLLENASAAFLDVVRRMMTPIRRAVGTTVVDWHRGGRLGFCQNALGATATRRSGPIAPTRSPSA